MVSTRISLPGRFLIYLPTLSNYIGISRQVEGSFREKLKEEAAEWSRGASLILRTMGAKAPPEILQKELKELQSRWQEIQKNFTKAKNPGLVWADIPLPAQVLRDTSRLPENLSVWVDREEEFLKLQEFAAHTMPEFKNCIQYYTKGDAFEPYGLKQKTAALLNKKVPLKSGGFIIIEETEAAVVVDVNTGRSRSLKNMERYVLKTNLEAARELARQLRLRNAGGIILIDFIDMEEERSRTKLMEVFKKELAVDRAYTEVLPVSELGVVEMTRKRRGFPLKTVLSEPCSVCQGSGFCKKIGFVVFLKNVCFYMILFCKFLYFNYLDWTVSLKPARFWLILGEPGF